MFSYVGGVSVSILLILVISLSILYRKKKAKAEKKPKIHMIIADSEEADSEVANGTEDSVME